MQGGFKLAFWGFYITLCGNDLMEWLAELLYAIAVMADIGAWAKSREFRKVRKQKAHDLFEPLPGKLAWFIFLLLTTGLVLWAIIWFWLRR